MHGQPLALFYTSTPELTLDDWEQILHSIVTYAQVVWLHPETRIGSQVPEDMRRHIESVFHELEAAGTLSRWALESSPVPSRLSSTARRIITADEELQLYDSLNAVIVGDETDRAGPFGEEFNLQSKFVEVRHELWNLGLAGLCNADGVVYRGSSTRRRVVPDQYRYEQINKKYTHELFNVFQIGSLVSLGAQDVLDLQKRSKSLRSKVGEILATKILPVEIPPGEVIADCRVLFDEYSVAVQDAIRERTAKRVLVETGKDVTIGGIGLVFPVIGAIPIAQRLVSWFRGRGLNGFLLYMLDLGQRAKGSARKSRR